MALIQLKYIFLEEECICLNLNFLHEQVHLLVSVEKSMELIEDHYLLYMGTMVVW